MSIIDTPKQIVRVARHISAEDHGSQLATESNLATNLATIYTKGRSGPRLVRQQHLSPATIKAMRGQIVAHFEAEDDGAVWHIGARVADLAW